MIKRALTIQPETLNEEDRIIEFSCSSEEPYNRGGYVEILSHDPSAIRLNRLSNKAAVLFNHKWDELIGVVEDVTIDAESKKLRVKVKFSKTEEGMEALTNVQDGILTKVSIGYIPLKYIVEGETEDHHTYTFKFSWSNKNYAPDIRHVYIKELNDSISFY